jgi:hypothetical protein
LNCISLFRELSSSCIDEGSWWNVLEDAAGVGGAGGAGAGLGALDGGEEVLVELLGIDAEGLELLEECLLGIVCGGG